LSPFVVLVTLALARHAAINGNGAAAAPVHTDWLAGILVAMWNYMGWDNASTVAGEVEDPQRTYPRVMLLAVAAVTLFYVIPVVAVWRAGVLRGSWSTGSWVNISGLFAGSWLGVALLVATMVSTFGSFNSLTLSLSRLPLAMAEQGYAPGVFRRTRPNGVPWVAVTVCGIAWMAALQLSFDRLLMLDILLYGVSLMLEFVALVKLRVREPKMPRPFAIPGGIPAVVLLGTGPALLLVAAAIKSRNEQLGSMSGLSVGLAIMAAGVVAYWLAEWRRRAAAI
jgi:amino acid transporter